MNLIFVFVFISVIKKNGWVQVKPGVTLSNVTPPNNLLLN